ELRLPHLAARRPGPGPEDGPQGLLGEPRLAGPGDFPLKVKVIGAGLSGCEAALQLADAGVDVDLFEMRPKVQTPAHKTSNLAELVCSNSFKGLALTSAHGLLKEELKRMGSRLIPLAMESRVPAGE